MKNWLEEILMKKIMISVADENTEKIFTISDMAKNTRNILNTLQDKVIPIEARLSVEEITKTILKYTRCASMEVDESKELAQAIYEAQSKKIEEMTEINKNFDEFWKDIVCNTDGSLNINQVKKELFDFYYVMEQVPKVYCHITGGKLSKLMYSAETIIAEADDLISQNYVHKKDLRDLL